MSWCLDCHRDPGPHLRPLGSGDRHGVDTDRRPRGLRRVGDRGTRARAARGLHGVPPMSAGATASGRREPTGAAWNNSREFPGRSPSGRSTARSGSSRRAPRKRRPSCCGTVVSRRSVLAMLGGTASLAGLTGCDIVRRPVEHIVPYVDAPEGMVPGVPLAYATTMPFGSRALGLLVESHEGRPTKVEGNELHPFSEGASSVWAQSSMLDLYDPDRSKSVRFGDEESSWDDFVAAWTRRRPRPRRRRHGLRHPRRAVLVADPGPAEGSTPRPVPAGALGDLGAGQRGERRPGGRRSAPASTSTRSTTWTARRSC